MDSLFVCARLEDEAAGVGAVVVEGFFVVVVGSADLVVVAEATRPTDSAGDSALKVGAV